ncbi:MAG: Rid family detoxifying hydrolase [Chloroflexi bacterium]|nr:Rid family detoxifying hydrolase [Chloroflexota bacterium]
MTIEVVRDPGSAAPIGPYSQGIKAGGFVFVAGEKGIDPATGKIVEGGIEAETRQTFENIRGILAAAGATMDHVVSTTVHMVNLADFARMNEVYGTFFTANPPGRTTVGVVALPAGAAVEITATAYVGG